LALVIMMVVGYFMRRRQARSAPSPFAFEGAGAPAQPQSPPQYNPRNVGNDASARPWEGQTASFEPATPARQGLSIGSGVAGSATTWGIPPGFDVEGFVAAAKQNFVHLQDAWDRSDIPALKAMMTDTMLDEIKVQLAERESLAPGQVNKTEVVSLQAQLLGIEELENDFLASIEFTGLIREDPSAGPSPFREIWNMGRPKHGQMGWLVAGVQALQ
jgi:predicted lipid-binding transport protein (Tim44 family)